MKQVSVSSQKPAIPQQDALILELNRLLACYQLASQEDREIVWSVLNKYVDKII